MKKELYRNETLGRKLHIHPRRADLEKERYQFENQVDV
jgi:hypothetical protein